MPIPAEVLLAASHPDGGQLVIVIGAGTSLEPPTSLRLSADYAEEAHRRLLADNILHAPCADATNLSLIADAVFERTGSQDDLVCRLPLGEFMNAQPNEGHLLAAALMLEGAVRNCLTLNYDLAMFHALALLGGATVAVVLGPEHLHHMGVTNLVHLNGCAFSEPRLWILRSTSLNDAWRDSWQAAITSMALTSRVVVFVGLGTPAPILTDSVLKIRAALSDANSVFCVGPGDPAASRFFADLRLSPDYWIPMEWIEFMRALSTRVSEEQRNQLVQSCASLSAELNLVEETAAAICERLVAQGLYVLGRRRAMWMLDKAHYLVRSSDRDLWMADLVLAIALIERVGNCVAQIGTDGLVEFREDSRILSVVVLAHGKGLQRWSGLEDAIARNRPRWNDRLPIPRSAIIAGVTGERAPASAPPIHIVGSELDGSIVSGPNPMSVVSVDELRADPARVAEILER